MNRRGFFGAAAGATVAGPDIARNYAQSGIAQGMFAGSGSQLAISAMAGMEPDDAIRKAFRLGIITRGKVAELLATSGLTDNVSEFSLDPDLRSAKSFSLSTRIRMQRERNADRSVDRFLTRPKSIWDHGRDLISKGLVGGDDLI